MQPTLKGNQPPSSTCQNSKTTNRAFVPEGEYHVYVETLSLAELIDKFPPDSCYRKEIHSIMQRQGPTVIGFPKSGTDRWTEIAIWLPDVDDETLEDLARQIPDAGNYLSEDYMHSATMLVWHADTGAQVRVDEFVFYLANGLRRNDLGFGVAFVNKSSVRYATHHLSAAAMYSLLCYLQVCSAGSRWNYKPSRIWGEEVLQLRQGLIDVAKPGIHIAELVSITSVCDI
jgi:hypothetical protein